jgi:hypothetical protein
MTFSYSPGRRTPSGPSASRTDAALVNETLCKVLAHNLCVLIQEQHELGIEPIFWKEAPKDGPAALAV